MNLLLNIRRVAALVIAFSMVLPQYACTRSGNTRIYSPLDEWNALDGVPITLLIYLVPLVLVIFRPTAWFSMLAALGTTLLGLAMAAYVALLLASELLAGWYTHVVATAIYSLTTVAQLVWRPVLRRRQGG